jgi:hypothetical protein
MRFRGQASPEHSIRLNVYVTGCGREGRLMIKWELGAMSNGVMGADGNQWLLEGL